MLDLEPEASYDMAKEAGQRGHALTITSQTLWKRLKEKGLLLTTDPTRATNTVRRTVEHKRIEVLHLHAATVVDVVPQQATSGPAKCPIEGLDSR